MKHKQYQLILIIFTLLFLFITPALAGNKTFINNIRYWTAPDHTRIVFDVENLPQYKISPEGDQLHLIMELDDTASLLPHDQLKIGDGLIDTVRLKTKDGKTMGVVINLSKPAFPDIFTLNRFQQKPERLVIDIWRKAESLPAQKKKPAAAKEIGKRVVLIDPGHGGEDSGAIGCCLKLEEKWVVLSIAKRLQYILKNEPNIITYLTRSGDYYLSLRRRTELASQYKADLMISIHGNSNPVARMRGLAAYYLSPSAASDKAAELVAQQENAADLMGGVSLGQDKTLNAIIIDMLQSSSITESVKLGELTLKSFQGVPDLTIDKKLHSAPFAVLKSPSVPSILVEVAYLSNYQDERMLADPEFHRATAEKLAAAIKEYLAISAPPENLLVEGQAKEGVHYHIVQPGETVWRIANQYGVSLQQLRQANGLGHTNLVKTGQKLVIP